MRCAFPIIQILGTRTDHFAPSVLQVEDVKKEISDFMQSQSVAKEMTESDADMVKHSFSLLRSPLILRHLASSDLALHGGAGGVRKDPRPR